MMKKLILILCILQGVLLSLRAQGEQQNIAYTDNNVRFTVCLLYTSPSPRDS